jgi:hypothetical protein
MFNPAIVKRIEKRKRGNVTSKGMPCIICGKLWDTCPHSVGEVISAYDTYQSLKLLGMK